ncbi:polysaccharide pyruvyl transferase family protein [Vibrio owensii]|uniref:polysaccharide pyruvyl transferase family protein n=1 Tax=Vibrio owensii TaxID=696485 RepID=UPI000597DA24|nr:polysaccharide pyruvyl transferase family protein [Vibrio owensii]
MKKIVLLNDTESDSNWGCKTTSKYLKYQLSRGGNNITSIPISFSSSSKERVSGHLKTIFLLMKLWFLFIPLKKLFKYYFTNISWNSNYYKKISCCDVCVLNGEGTIHVFNRAVSKWMFYLLVAKYVFDKKYYIVNHTFNIDTVGVKYITKDAYRRADKIFVREGISKDIIIDQLLVDKNKLFLVADAAFLVEKSSVLTTNLPEKKYFVVCGNVISNDEAVANLSELVVKVRDELGLKPVFLVADIKDLTFYNALKERVTDLQVIDNEFDVAVALDFIDKAELFITGRFHPYIFSLTVQTPTFTFSSNTHKIEGVKKMVGDTTPEINLSDIELDFLKIKKFITRPANQNRWFNLDSLKNNIVNSYSLITKDE